MTVSRRHILAAGAAATLIGRSAGAQGVPAGYPADYGKLVEAAHKEGRVSIYTSTDSAQAQTLVDAFRAAHPSITVDWNDLGTNATFNRVISEAAAGQMGADLVWTSAMDQLISLVDRGLTETYRSPESGALPSWAIYKDQAYGTTIEPAAVLYNRSLLPEAEVPRSHAALLALLTSKRDALRNKVGSFDPEKSGTGYMFANVLSRSVPQFWELIRAFGAAGGKVYSSSGQMREKAASGEHVLLFNVIGSYALEWVKASPNLGVAFLSDHVPALARVALIPKGTPRPNAGRLLLDFMLSAQGQKLMGERMVPSIRTDISGDMSLDGINRIAGGNLKPIPVDASTAALLDTKSRIAFLGQWRKAMQG